MQARILIADDNPVVRKTLKHLLENLPDVEVIEAEDGESAIARTLESHPDVVILDLAMPILDGLNAAREISKLVPHGAILMYTMHWSELLAVEAQKSGVRKVVSKAQSSVLLAEVQKAIAARPPNSETGEGDPPATSTFGPSAVSAKAEPGMIVASDPSSLPDLPKEPPLKH